MIATIALVLKLSLKFNEEDQSKTKNKNTTVSSADENGSNEESTKFNGELKNEANIL